MLNWHLKFQGVACCGWKVLMKNQQQKGKVFCTQCVLVMDLEGMRFIFSAFCSANVVYCDGIEMFSFCEHPEVHCLFRLFTSCCCQIVNLFC